MKGNVNNSKRISPYDLNGIAKLSAKPVSLTEPLLKSRRDPEESDEMSGDTSYWLDKINDLKSDNFALLGRNINLIADNNALEARLAGRNAMIERLVEAGNGIFEDDISQMDYEFFFEGWLALVAEYQASKKETK